MLANHSRGHGYNDPPSETHIIIWKSRTVLLKTACRDIPTSDYNRFLSLDLKMFLLFVCEKNFNARIFSRVHVQRKVHRICWNQQMCYTFSFADKRAIGTLNWICWIHIIIGLITKDTLYGTLF